MLCNYVYTAFEENGPNSAFSYNGFSFYYGPKFWTKINGPNSAFSYIKLWSNSIKVIAVSPDLHLHY